MPEFDPYNIGLGGHKMIEASAGTGKTFSVALLAVRLIAERGVPVGKILMMTFTNAAVAELAERIRLFIRTGHACLDANDTSNPALVRLLVTDKTEEQKDVYRSHLKRAVLEMDQLSVMTIHSFCSRVLSRFAFETGQTMGSEPLDDLDLIVTPVVDDFWRRRIATMNEPLLIRLFTELDFKKDDIVGAVKDSLGGKEYAFMDQDATINDLLVDEPSFDEIVEKDPHFFRNFVMNINNAITRNGYLKLLDSENFLGFAEKLKQAIKEGAQYLNRIPEMVRRYNDSCTGVKVLFQRIVSLAIKETVPEVNRMVQEGNLITYNDMVDRMRQALEGPNAAILKDILRDEYDAVFIDEFQDTDSVQFEIFRRSFMEDAGDFDGDREDGRGEGDGSGGKTVFLIGDPKQMIYAWRKADMGTYLRARDVVREGQVYQMRENFRSSKRLIQAMNIYFRETKVFDVFLLGGEVSYIDVNYPSKPKTRGELMDAATKSGTMPIEISVGPNKRAVKRRMMEQLAGLIGAGAEARIPDAGSAGGYRKVTYSDIGILVRKNKEAKEIKKLLSKYGIPAIQIDDTSIFQTEEAELMLYLLAAFLDRRPDNVRRAMFSSITGLTYDDILKLDLDSVTESFKRCSDILSEKGVFAAMHTFMEIYRVRHYLVFQAGVRGERAYANLHQLLESLHNAESDMRLSPEQLVIWLRKRISDARDTEGEFAQRLESDEDAVKIVTIHKSKGLEYNVVFAPFLNLKKNKKALFRSFRKDGQHYFVDKHNMEPPQDTLSDDEIHQENRRIMYVAVTRAKYKAFLHWNVNDNNRDVSVIELFIEKLKTQQKEGESAIWIREPDDAGHRWTSDTLIGIHEYSQKEIEGLRYPRKSVFARPAAAMTVPTPRVFAGEPPMDIWRRLSYSAIKSKSNEKGVVREKVIHKDALDDFVFSGFPKGAKAGTILHTILERIDFTEQETLNWDPVIQEVLRFYRLKGDRDEQTLRLREWIHELLETELTINGHTFTLSQVPPSDLIPEFEFDFKLDEFQVADLFDAAGDTPVRLNAALGSLKGIMNGKMDIFFRHEGRYYILDWKTNHLGYTLEDYGADQVRSAMEESNYNLQYLIYSVAARKYLANRMDNFDYERDFGGVIYLFVRGVRKGHETGIYIDRIGQAALDRFENAMSASA